MTYAQTLERAREVWNSNAYLPNFESSDMQNICSALSRATKKPPAKGFCPNCHSPLDDNRSYCGDCGQAIQWAPIAPDKQFTQFYIGYAIQVGDTYTREELREDGIPNPTKEFICIDKTQSPVHLQSDKADDRYGLILQSVQGTQKYVVVKYRDTYSPYLSPDDFINPQKHIK